MLMPSKLTRCRPAAGPPRLSQAWARACSMRIRRIGSAADRKMVDRSLKSVQTETVPLSATLRAVLWLLFLQHGERDFAFRLRLVGRGEAGPDDADALVGVADACGG